ncbi:MAG: manganese efflux pump MntP family protein [Clostridium sp.]|jgi:putative Mn2+ efflux pump MntP|nr:manganese efflux pump MntP family protein [Clostridium sp.]
MKWISLLLIAASLSMDAFAVALCKGLALPKLRIRHAVIVGLWFGGFQALMPLIGYFTASHFHTYIVDYDHWIALALLSLIGFSMIRSAFQKEHDEDLGQSLAVKVMLPLAIATSIDALAIGVTFAFLQVEIWTAVLLIGAFTLAFSMIGVKAGNVFGLRFKAKAEIVGGVVLILMGIRILLEHLEILPTIAM